MAPAPQHRRATRARSPALAALVAAALALATAAAVAAPSRPVVVRDPAGDPGDALDLTRVASSRAADGRLRAVLTFAGRVTAATLLATSGPPGSACLRIWTDDDADPAAMRPDRLVCVTASSRRRLRAGVFEQPDAGLPRRVGAAAVSASASGRSLVVRFSQSSLGRPPAIRLAAEATPPGCDRATCVDTAPDGGAVRRLRLR